MSHLLTMSELSEVEISEILKRRRRFCEWKRAKRQSKLLLQTCSLNSTRTRFSFEVAEKRLGLDVLNFSADASSVQKEKLYTIR